MPTILCIDDDPNIFNFQKSIFETKGANIGGGLIRLLVVPDLGDQHPLPLCLAISHRRNADLHSGPEEAPQEALDIVQHNAAHSFHAGSLA